MLRRGGAAARGWARQLSRGGLDAAASAAAAAPLAEVAAAGRHAGRQAFSPHLGAARGFSLWPSRGGEPAAPTAAGEGFPDDGTGGAATAVADAAAAATAAGAGAASFSPDAIVAAAAAAEVAALEAATEGAWLPTKALDYLLATVHNGTGLPWWGSIMLTTAMVRLATVPLMLMQVRNTAALSAARPEVEALLAALKESQARGDPGAVAEYQKQVMGVWSRHKANPAKSFASLLVQAPLFVGFFSALRGLAAAKVPSLAAGGALWFTDLTVADPTYALPCIASATFLLTVEAGAADGMEGQPDAMKRRMKNVMRGVAVIIVPFTLDLPAAVFCYWTASNAFSLFQTLALKIPGARRRLGLPEVGRGAALAAAKPGAAAAEAAAASVAGRPVATFAQRPPKPKSKKP
jgi:YidC/Oxa1 family membrane protein insertase